MTRSYTLDNWDGHLSKFDSHKAVRGQALSPPLEASLPASATSAFQRPILFSSNPRASVVEESLNGGRSDHSADDASNERPFDTMPHPFEKTRLFNFSDFSDTNYTSDIVTDALNSPSPLLRDSDPRSPSISKNGTRRSPFSGFPPKPKTFVPSPALTVQTISTYTADAHGEEEDEDVIIVSQVRTSFPPENKPLDEAPTSNSHDSLFTPPPSEGGLFSASESPPPLNHGKRSWTRVLISPAPRKIRMVASHVLVPSLLKPKSAYVKLPSLVQPARKCPHRTAQDGLKDALNAIWQNNESLHRLGEHGDGGGSGKKRKRKHKPQEGRTRPVAGPSQSSHDNEESVVFVNRMPTVTPLVEEKPAPAQNIVIDLTLDDDDDGEKSLNLRSPPSQSILEVTEETLSTRQPASGETRLRIGVVHSISYKTLLHNTRFLRGTKRDADPHRDFVAMASFLPFRRRRALLDHSGESSSLDDEFSLGYPVATEFGLGTADEGYDDDDSGYEAIELLESSSESPPKPVLSPGTPASPTHEPLSCPPKIDLAAKFRKKKTSATRRTSGLTPVKKAAPFQPASTSAVSRSPRKGLVPGVVNDDDGYDPHTPLVPSAKALGKRKAAESPLQAMQLRPDIQSSFPSSRTAESLPASTTATADNNFDYYINYWPSPGRPVPDNPFSHLGAGDAYVYPVPYSNPTLSSINNFVDHRHYHHPNPSYSSVEPPAAASLLYHSDDYTRTADNFGHFASSVLGDPPPPSETSLLPAWSPELNPDFHYDDFTVNPSLLGGEPLGMSEHPEPYFLDVGNEFFDTEKEQESCSISKMSPSRSGSPMTLSSTKSEPFHPVHTRRDADSETIFVRRRRPTTSFVSTDSPNGTKRLHVQRSILDMVPSSVLNLSSSSSDETEDESGLQPIKSWGGVRSTPSNHTHRRQQESKTKSRPTVARKAAATFPAGLNVTGPKVMLGGQPWPMQDEAAYCHQCRNKTMVLKLECPGCSKLFCVRCLTLRYPDQPRALQMEEARCPACHGYCNCTKCCERRGVQYISTKNALAGVPSTRLKAPRKSKFPSPGVSYSPSLSRSSVSDPSNSNSRAPITPTGGVYWGVVYGADGLKVGSGFSFAKEDVSERSPAESAGGVYWGVVYGADGSKIGAGFTFAKEDVGKRSSAKPDTEAGTIVPPRTKQKRVYVGKIHPSWQFDGAVKKSVLEPVPPPKRVHESRRPRKYVGNKAFLFYKSEKMARELADLSPLSSLEEDWDEEDWRMDMVEEGDGDGETNGVVDQEDTKGRLLLHVKEKKDRACVSLKILSDQDVMRAIGLGLHACGIQLAA